MRHELLIVPIVATQLGEVVGVKLALGEMHGEAGDAGVHRIADGVNDDGVGQRQMDEAGIAESSPASCRRSVSRLVRAATVSRDSARPVRETGAAAMSGTKSGNGSDRGVARPMASAVCSNRVSSPAPNICGWLANICSMRVVPERGIPTMNTGTGDRAPAPSRSLINVAGEQFAGAVHLRKRCRFVVSNLLAFERIGGQQLAKGAVPDCRGVRWLWRAQNADASGSRRKAMQPPRPASQAP